MDSQPTKGDVEVGEDGEKRRKNDAATWRSRPGLQIGIVALLTTMCLFLVYRSPTYGSGSLLGVPSFGPALTTGAELRKADEANRTAPKAADASSTTPDRGRKGGNTNLMTGVLAMLVLIVDVHNWYSNPEDESPNSRASCICWWMKLLTYVAVWYTATTTYAVASKHVLHSGGGSSLTTLLMLVQVLVPASLALSQRSVLRAFPKEQMRLYLASGGAFYFQSLFTLQGLSLSANVDYVLSLKACEPLTTVVLMILIQGLTAISPKQVGCVLVAVFGLLISAGVLDIAADSLGSWQVTLGITALVFLANFCVSSRNLVLFAASSNTGSQVSKGQIFTTTCFFAFSMGLVVSALTVVADVLREGPSTIRRDLGSLASEWRDVVACSLSFGLYNYCSFVVLSFVQPTMHSLLASAKRLFTVVLVWLIEYRYPTAKDIVGVVLLLVGAMGVELLKPPATVESQAKKAKAVEATVASVTGKSALVWLVLLALLTSVAVGPAWIRAFAAIPSNLV